MRKPLISVIMPVYNTPCEYLVDAVHSILTQTYKNFELIIIDDGSNSKTKAILKSFNDNRINLIFNENNLGLVATLNRGLSLASGEYIARMDSDDISLKNRFKKQVEFLEDNPEIGVLGTACAIFQKKEEDVYLPCKDELIRELILACHSPFIHPSIMMRSSVLQDIQYDSNYPYCEDLALWIELFDKTKFANLPEILIKYRWHGANVSKKHTIIQSIDTQKLMFLNFEKFYGKDVSAQLKVLDKIKDGKLITGKEFKLLLEFSDIYPPNRQFIRTARKCCSNLILKLLH